MGFDLSAVFSSPVDRERKQDVLASAIARWSFVRMPRQDYRYSQCAHFAAPELTEYLYHDDDAYEQAVEECGELEESLPEWSAGFPSESFAFVQASCFGGTCLYSGFVCKQGTVTFRQEPDHSGHRRLLEHVNILLKDDRFAPFERGYFA